jgi:hypothetical protein
MHWLKERWMTSSMTSESLAAAVRSGFGTAASLRVRRPGKIFQVEVPAFLDDGDGVQLYLEPAGSEKWLVSDLGQTLMRISYTRPIDDAAMSHVGRLAERNGFKITEGAIGVEVPMAELVPALFGLAQVQAVAEATLRAPKHRGPRAEDFRELVMSALREAFKERLREHVVLDSEEAFTVDAVIEGPRPLGVFAVPNDLEAERAIGTCLRAKALDVRDWVAIPRDIDDFTNKTRARLVDTFLIARATFDGPAVGARLERMAS